jgi:hypothetical protein
VLLQADVNPSKATAFVAITLLLVACAAASDDAPDDIASSSSALTCSAYDATTGAALAAAAAKRNGQRSQHRCYAYVKKHLAAAGVKLPPEVADGKYGASAYMFATWAKANPNDLAAAGLAKTSASLDSLPKGAIVVWPRGDCGYSKVHGHIEVVVDDASSRACSDFCGELRMDCSKPPDVFIPVKKGDGGPGAGCDGANGDAGGDARAPQADSCVGRAAGWYCSELRNFSAYKCNATGSIVLGYQCASGGVCVAGANGQAALGGDGNPQCGGAK